MTLPINPSLLLEAFRGDNRIVGLAVPYLLKDAGYTLERERSGHMLVAPGQRLKVRALTKNGLSLGPSSGKGVGRSFSESAWQQTLATITGFLIVDTARLNGELHYWVLPVERVRQRRHLLTWDCTCSRQVALDLFLGGIT